MLPSPRDLLVWQHAVACLRAAIPVTLLLVVSSSGASPGRPGFKMSVAPGSMVGSVGGGIVEYRMVELARHRMAAGQYDILVREHLGHEENGHEHPARVAQEWQTVVLLPLSAAHLPALRCVADSLQRTGDGWFSLNASGAVQTGPGKLPGRGGLHPATAVQDWYYDEQLGFRTQLTIVGGGHVGLALSRVAATLDFRITVLDDRPGLNTLLINPYAHEKRTVPYDRLAREVPEGPHHYAVIMTFGYRSDAVALRQLLPLRLAYLGLMATDAKAGDLLHEMRTAGYSAEQLARVHSPIGVPIHSRTPEEIAISVAAELIRVRNAPYGPID